MKHYTDCQDEYDVSVILMPTCINGLKKLAESFNATEEEYLLALGDLADCFFHYINIDEAPKLKTPLSQIAFEFAKEQVKQAEADSASLPDKAIGYAEQQNNKRISNGVINISNLKAL